MGLTVSLTSLYRPVVLYNGVTTTNKTSYTVVSGISLDLSKLIPSPVPTGFSLTLASALTLSNTNGTTYIQLVDYDTNFVVGTLSVPGNASETTTLDVTSGFQALPQSRRLIAIQFANNNNAQVSGKSIGAVTTTLYGVTLEINGVIF